MKKFLICGLMLSLYSSAVGTVINFDDVVIPHDPPTEITNEYIDLGVIFQNNTQIHAHGTPDDAPSKPNVIKSDDSEVNPVTLDAYFIWPGHSDILGTVPWFEITQDLGTASGGGTLEAYDIDGNLVDSVEDFNGSGSTFRVESASGIHRVYVGSCADDLDNFAYGEIVPEPATILILGLGGLAVMRKRKQ